MRLQFNKFSQGIALLTFILFLAGCTTDENVTPQNLPVDERTTSLTGTPTSTLLYGLSDRNEIVKLMSGPPAAELSRVTISGLMDGDLILAIDIRPSTRQIYGISSSSRLYIIDPTFGIAQLVSAARFSPEIGGSIVGFDFDPRMDRIRLVTEKGQNIRINPTTGAVSNVDFPINQNLASINSIAYASVSSSLTGNSLYDIDLLGGMLYRQNPIQGTLSLVGSLGLVISGEGGFDISRTGAAYATLYAGTRGGSTLGGSSADSEPAYRLYYINLKTGKATNIGRVNVNLIGLTIP